MRQADTEGGESPCGIGFVTVNGMSPRPLRWVPYMTIFGRRIEVHLSVAVFRGLLLAIGWFALWTALPRPLMELNGSVFDPLLAVFMSAVLGGSICHYFRLPSQIGILLAAVVWGNIAGGYFTEGIVTEVRFIASRMGLTVIVSRAGFAVNFKEIKKIWKNVVALSLLPMLTEALVHALAVYLVMDYPDFRWCLIEGFVVSGISPGVVVPPLLGLREEGFGHTGPTSLMLFSVVLDSLGSIWATSFFIDLIFSDLDLAVSIALGPIQLIGGVILGIVLAFVLHLITKVFVTEVAAEDNGMNTHTLKYPQYHLDHVHYKVFACYTLMAVCLVFGGDRINLAGGGAIGVLSLSATVAHLWAPRAPHLHLAPQSDPHTHPQVPHPAARAHGGVAKAVELSEVSVELPPAEEIVAQDKMLSVQPVSAVSISEPFGKLEPHLSDERRVLEGSFSAWNTEYNADGTHVRVNSDDDDEECVENIGDKKIDTVSSAITPTEEAMITKCENHFFPAERQRLFLDYAWLWDNLVMPALFAGTGTVVDLYGTFDMDFFPKAIFIILVGVVARILMAMVCSLGQGFSYKELLFVGLGWCGKAAVQAVLGGTALAKAEAQTPQDPAFIKAGVNIQRTAMMSAIFMATLSGLAVVNLGRQWLPRKKM